MQDSSNKKEKSEYRYEKLPETEQNQFQNEIKPICKKKITTNMDIESMILEFQKKQRMKKIVK
jgi:FixJ family two-component response regulator